MDVAILPTGRMELVGLPRALGRLFPDHHFFSIPRIVGSDIPFDGFTSARLPVVGGPESALDKLVQAMVGHLVPGRRGDPPDYLVLIDDLELANADQAGVVVSELKKAVTRHLCSLEQGLHSRVRNAIAQRASFHLAVPMAESWLFADPSGPANAGAPPGHLPARLTPGCDPELFDTNDPDYLLDDGSSCNRWNALSGDRRGRRRKAHKPEWLKAQRRRRPKSYLAWLCRNREAKRCSTYRETSAEGGVKTGAAALADLNWRAALSTSQHCTYLRSLVEDIADALGEDIPLEMRGEVAPLTSRHHLPAKPLLRNL